ncbi:MAG: hypothetical protein KatS3mg076_0225 [Candidatus Binatia bacterium]|nr:MAG: hypothetical protein KatS3mg076_0225 [Candidatus Binatia bacterium]
MAQEAARDPTELVRLAIREALPDAEVEVRATSPGHVEIDVTSAEFEGKSLVAQQQLVYRSIAHLMRGEGAPLHAVDRLRTRCRDRTDDSP